MARGNRPKWRARSALHRTAETIRQRAKGFHAGQKEPREEDGEFYTYGARRLHTTTTPSLPSKFSRTFGRLLSNVTTEDCYCNCSRNPSRIVGPTIREDQLRGEGKVKIIFRKIWNSSEIAKIIGKLAYRNSPAGRIKDLPLGLRLSGDTREPEAA